LGIERSGEKRREEGRKWKKKSRKCIKEMHPKL